MNSYWKNVRSVLTGSALSQAIPIFGTIIIARQYTPADFGIFSVWLGVVLLLGVLLTGRFETALAIEPDGEPRRLAVAATLITIILSAVVAAVFLSIALQLRPEIADKFPGKLLIIFIPTGVVIAIAQTWQTWAAAEGAYRHLSYMRISQAAATTIFQIIAGFFTPSASAMGVAFFFGITFSLLTSIILMPLGIPHRKKIIKIVSNFWRKHYRFPMLSLPADAINTVAIQLPVFLVASRFGAEIAGFLSMAMRILGAPIGLLAKAVLDVFKRHAATSYREQGECREVYIRTLKVLSAGSLIFITLMIIIGESFFPLAFGEQWRGAGVISMWLLPLFALRFVASPLSYMVYISGKQHIDLLWQIALLTMTIATLYTQDNYKMALQFYSIGYSLLYVVYLIMSYRFSLGDKN